MAVVKGVDLEKESQEAKRFEEQAETQLVVAQKLVITTVGEYQNTGEKRKEVNQHLKELKTTRESFTQPLEATKKRIIAFFKPAETKWKQVKDLLDAGMLGWEEEEAERQRIEDARLLALAQEEQDRLQAQAEARAEEAEESGNAELADEIMDNVPQVEMSVVKRTPTKVDGVSTRTLWRFRVVNVDLVPRDLMIPDEKVLGEIARESKGTAEVPGVEFYSEKIKAS